MHEESVNFANGFKRPFVLFHSITFNGKQTLWVETNNKDKRKASEVFHIVCKKFLNLRILL